MSPFSSAAVSKKVRKKRSAVRPSVRQEKASSQDQLFLIIPLRLSPPSRKEEKKKIKQILRVFYFSLSEPKVHGQSSPMCLHPPRSRSLIFQHYKLRASSHLKRATKCKERGVGDPRTPPLPLCLSPGCPSAKSASRVLFYPPPSNATSQEAALHSPRYLLSRLSCEQHDSLPVCRSPRSPGGSRSTTCALHRSPSALTRRLLLPSPQSHRPRKAALRFGKHHETPPNKPGNSGGKEHKRETFRRGSYAAFPLLAVPCAARRAAALFRRRRGHAATVRQNHPSVHPSVHRFIFKARFFLH